VLSAEVFRNREGRKRSCQLMAENDNSWSQEDDLWRKPTRHVEMVGRQAGFFAQSPVLSTQSLFSLISETLKINHIEYIPHN
jgi:hypothetical protein